MSFFEERCVHISIETRNSYSSNHGGCGRRCFETIHSSSHNNREYVVRGGYRSQETIHSSSFNWGEIVDVEGRVGYRSL